MTSQHNALLEAMEQQAVSIAKSGIVNTLPARAAVLAAANPIGGHYNRAKTVAENLKINPALLSRCRSVVKIRHLLSKAQRVAYSDQSCNPVCGFSIIEQVRLCTVCPMENWLGTSKTPYRVG